MRGADWYVMQVETGRELAACQAVERACRLAERLEAQAAEDADLPAPRPMLQECFAPRYRTQYKLHGQWFPEEKLLLPGYVVVVSFEPGRVAQVLRQVPGFTRILTMGETFAPLSQDDRSWIERWIGKADRVIPMSVAYKEGDKLVVTEGPLAGQEARILKIRRRQSLAEVEVTAGQMRIRTTVGLKVLPGEPDAPGPAEK